MCFLMSRMRIEGVRLKITPGIYCDRSLLVWSSRMSPLAICLGLWEMISGVVEEFVGMEHSLVVFLFPVMTPLLFFII